ncbi:hypothetical protein ACJD0Z_01975 [Flavobacteriaceae bacterium M23B6Z8]
MSKIMDENLEHIDLIDKYLNDDLNSEEQKAFERLSRKSPAFRRDLEVYQQMYRGMEAFEEDDELRKRLATYHESFIKEKHRKRQVRTLLVTGLSMAAAVVFGWFFVFRSADPNTTPLAKPEENIPKIEKKDSTERQKLHETRTTNEVLVDKQTDTATIKMYDEENTPALALGGFIKLPSKHVKSVSYPTSLLYTFDGRKLHLFGDPLLPALRVQVGKTASGGYILLLKNKFYLLEISKNRVPLQITNRTFSGAGSYDEQIEILVSDIRPLASIANNIEVLINKIEGLPITYRFEKKAEKIRIFLNGNPDLNRISVWRLDFKGKLSYYLEMNGSIYELSSDATEFRSPASLNILKNDSARLFRKRAPVIKQLIIFE